MSTRKLRKREDVRVNLLGGISKASLWRIEGNPEMGFPKPFMVGGAAFFDEAEVLAWIEARRKDAAA